MASGSLRRDEHGCGYAVGYRHDQGGGGGGDGIGMLREDFVDTPYWNAELQTNAQGVAKFTVTLPDNLTTWHLDVRAITLADGDGEMLVGQNTHDLVSTRPLIVRPVTPRFMVVDDVLTLGAVVNNNTGKPLTVDVNLQAQGVKVQSELQQRITVAAGSAQRVDWVVKVNEVDGVSLIVSARDVQGLYVDAARPDLGSTPDHIIPVYRYEVPETVATSGVLRGDETRTGNAHAAARIEAEIRAVALGLERWEAQSLARFQSVALMPAIVSSRWLSALAFPSD